MEITSKSALVEGYEDYEVYDGGRVYSHPKNYKTSHKGRFLKESTNKKGYKSVYLSDSNGQKGFFVHRLVAKAFTPNPENKPQINHIDGDKTNNHVSNLEWCTNTENMGHAKRMGLRNTEAIIRATAKTGKARRSITFKQAEEIRKICKDKKIKQKDVANLFNIDHKMVSEIVLFKRYKTP